MPAQVVDEPLTSADAVIEPVPETVPEALGEPVLETAPDAGGPPHRGGYRWRRDLVAPAVALVLSLVALAVVGGVSLADPGARERDARAATAAARVDLEQLLSYDHQTIAAQVAQNAALLTGPFRDEYATTMRTTIAPVAQKTKSVVRARTYEAGVVSQEADTVTVQLFVNQAKTAQGQEQPSVDQNRVIATMRRVDGRWLVARLAAY